MANKKPFFVVFTGDQPPAWGTQGYQRLATEFNRKQNRDLTMLIQPNQVSVGRGDNQRWVDGKGWAETIQDARKNGYSVERITDRLPEQAAATLGAVGSPHTAADIRAIVTMHMTHGNGIAVKDMTFFMAMAARGGHVMDATVKRGADDKVSLELLDRTIFRRGADADLHVGSTYGLKLAYEARSFGEHTPGLATHQRYDHMTGSNRVQLPTPEVFIYGTHPRGSDGGWDQGNVAAARALDAYITYHKTMRTNDVANQKITFATDADRDDFRYATITPGGDLHKLLDPRGPLRREQIGLLATKALNEGLLQTYSVQTSSGQGQLPDNFYAKVGLRIGAHNPTAGGNVVQFGAGSEKEYKNSWDQNKPNSTVPSVSRMEVNESQTRYAESVAGYTAGPGTYVAQYPVAGQSTNSSPTPSVAGPADQSDRRARSDGDSPVSHSPIASGSPRQGSVGSNADLYGVTPPRSPTYQPGPSTWSVAASSSQPAYSYSYPPQQTANTGYTGATVQAGAQVQVPGSQATPSTAPAAGSPAAALASWQNAVAKRSGNTR